MILTEAQLSEIEARREAVAREMRLFRSEHSANVFGLPCICDSPQYHSDTCVAIRQLFIVLDNQAARNEDVASGYRKMREALEGAEYARTCGAVYMRGRADFNDADCNCFKAVLNGE